MKLKKEIKLILKQRKEIAQSSDYIFKKLLKNKLQYKREAKHIQTILRLLD